MRAELLAGLVTIAAAAPFSAQAGGDHARMHRVIAVTAPAAIAPPGMATPPSTATPEMNSGLAAIGVTLLLGGVSVLRSRRPRSDA